MSAVGSPTASWADTMDAPASIVPAAQAAVQIFMVALSAASAHRSLQEKAGMAEEDWHRPESGEFRRRIAAIHPDATGLLLARRCMAGERTGHGLQATALSTRHLRLIDVQHVIWQNRAHFLAMSVRLMGLILVDYARSQRATRSGVAGQ